MSDTFSKSEIDHIVKIKAKMAFLIQEHVPLFLTDPAWGMNLDWCIAGGMFAHLFHDKTYYDGKNLKDLNWSDIDVFIFDGHRFTSSRYYNEFKHLKHDYESMAGEIASVMYHPSFGITQFIVLNKAIADPQKVSDRIDLVHCMPYYYDNTLYISKQQYDAVESRTMVLNPLSGRNQLASKRRVKWEVRGYSFDSTF